MPDKISYSISKRVSPKAVQQLFARNELNSWFSVADTKHYLRKAILVATAWAGRKCVGVAVLTGDGRITAELDVLLVDASFRKQRIGSSLMAKVMAKVEKLRPYHFKVEVHKRSAEKFYMDFGFRKNKGTWLLEHGVAGERLHSKVVAY
jgi:GNAT superfamily N-acetyltransferase